MEGTKLLKHTFTKKCHYLILRKVPRYDNNEGYCKLRAAIDMNIIEISQYNCPCCCCKIRSQPNSKTGRSQNIRYQSFSRLGILPVLEEKRLWRSMDRS